MEPSTATTRLKQGLDLVMLGHTHRKLAANQRHLDQYREGLMQQAGLPPTSRPNEDEMLILGDNTVIHQPPPPPVPTPAAAPTGLGTVGKLIAVGLAASGVGLPASIAAWHLPAILDALKPAAVTAPAADPPPPASDQDTWLDIELGGGAGSDK